jgi:hypothetical protein
MKPELEKEIDRKALALIQQTRMETDGKFYREMVSTIKQYAEYTERLNWTLAHIGANFDFKIKEGKPEEHYITWFSNSAWWTVRGKDFRECIDNAIAGRAERI